MQTSNEKTRERCNVRQDSLSTRILGGDKTTDKQTGTIDSTPRKSSNDDLMHPSIRWLELTNERTGPITLDEMRCAPINSVFPIIYNTNNKDITDINNWAPCILRKIRKQQFEILDHNEQDKVDEDLDWDGDDVLSESWDIYYKNPTSIFKESVQADLQESFNNTEEQDVSPNCGSLRKMAAMNVQKKAHLIREAVVKKHPTQVFKQGDLVLVLLDDVDHTKVDGANLAGVVVSISKLTSTCLVTVKQGLLNRAYVYHVLKPVLEGSNNLDATDL